MRNQRSRWGLVAFLLLTFSCGYKDGQQAANMADPAIRMMYRAKQNQSSAEGNLTAAINAIFIDATWPNPDWLSNAGVLFQASQTSFQEAKKGLSSAVVLHIAPLQKRFYQLHIDLCDASLAFLEAASSEVKTLNAFAYEPGMMLDSEKIVACKHNLSDDESALKQSKEKIQSIQKDIDELVETHPDMFNLSPVI